MTSKSSLSRPTRDSAQIALRLTIVVLTRPLKSPSRPPTDRIDAVCLDAGRKGRMTHVRDAYLNHGVDDAYRTV